MNAVDETLPSNSLNVSHVEDKVWRKLGFHDTLENVRCDTLHYYNLPKKH